MATPYARRMAALSARIFGEVSKPTDQKSMKVVKMLSVQPANKNPEFVRYYPKYEELRALHLSLRRFGIIRDDLAEFKVHLGRARTGRGKKPPAKGEGKRAMKAKRKGGS
ncbi:28S ribosomal protein S33, mitochondrial [Lingula anatina]|uniref:Small ribosomal subunit protein mS33 n=1 Tax=Lingula anatina TaxID=7574 RepID=A0A1S3HJ36_LINAN|nr:28S ribosomal protein S33, mitochondrial [Lingula anatina]XP_013386028.1 28S ribosomal protein S33, mitochondrial [Lingula anatina]|eukprot:XP_013386027.1 28S ribosomal protein S33, mitochondrial [Lingula anatina]